MVNNNTVVEEVYNKHREWLIKVAYNFTRDHDDANELLQEMFIYLLEMDNIEKIRYKDSVNLFYLYKIIKTKYLSKKIPKNTTVELPEDETTTDEYDYAADEEFERLYASVTHELSDSGSNLRWFDKRLLTIYIEENHSLTSLSKATKISRSACWNSINRTKKYLKTINNKNL
jgi:DNA-directed RNA polymerase specialized sigma24 family protein